jgi:dipeptidase
MNRYKTPVDENLIPDDVKNRFEEAVLDLITSGHDYISVEEVVKTLRQKYRDTNRPFTFDNYFSSAMSRWFVKKYPDARPYFRMHRMEHHDPDGIL